MTDESESPRPAADLPAEQAVPRLVEEHGDRLYTLARRFCGNTHDAEDLVQETFLQAWRYWDSFRGDSSPSTWLYTIAARACQRMHRKRAGEPDRLVSLDEFPATGPVGDANTPLDDQVRRETREAAEAAIAALPDLFRMPLVLKDIVGLPIAQIAAIIGVPEATVKTRVHRARLAVRNAVAEHLPQRANVPPPAFPEQVCMDLLQAKMDALDRGAEFSLPEARFCERCATVFASLDLSTAVCRDIGVDHLPDELRAKLKQRT